MDIQKIREDFPILSRTVYGKPLVYFDNGATTQKPRLVVDSLVDECKCASRRTLSLSTGYGTA